MAVARRPFCCCQSGRGGMSPEACFLPEEQVEMVVVVVVVVVVVERRAQSILWTKEGVEQVEHRRSESLYKHLGRRTRWA